MVTGLVIGGAVGGAVGAPFGWAAYEVFKKTALFDAATAALAPELNDLVRGTGERTQRGLTRLTPFRAFVVRHQDALRRIADVGRHRWMLRYIDFIVRSSHPPD